MGNDSPPHLSPNLQIEMSKHKLRSEIGLLNTLQNNGESNNYPKRLIKALSIAQVQVVQKETMFGVLYS